MLAYFDFVMASQRADGNIPFSILPEEHADRPEYRREYFQGLKYPDDVFEYTQPGTGYPTRRWIGLFVHWVVENPLSILAPISYLLTAGEIYDAVKDAHWVKEHIDSIEAAAQYVLLQKTGNGLISGAGFYIERPPRFQWDGITQCYTYKAFHELAKLYEAIGNLPKAEQWKIQGDALRTAFLNHFYKTDRFYEYIHPEFGGVDWHGYTDVDWAAIGFGMATADIESRLIDQLCADESFWWGGMPTQLVTKPYAYKEWELGRPVNFRTGNAPLYDAAAMGRVWYVELLACLAAKRYERVCESVRMVARMGIRQGGFWSERYHMLQDRSVYPAGPAGYCEYPAILVRTVMGHPELFID